MSLADRRVGQATAWRFGYLIIQGGASLLLFAALAHLLDARDAAIAALAQAVLVLAQALGDFGLSQAAVTVLPAQLAQHPEQREGLQAGAARAFLWAALLALVLAWLAALAVPADAFWAVIAVGPAASASVVVAGADGLLRSSGEFRRPLELVALSRSGSFAAIPVALATHDPLLTCLALSAGTLLTSLPAVHLLLSHQAGTRDRRSREVLAASVPLGVTQLFVIAGGRLNTVILGSYLSLAAAAAFECTWRLFQLALYIAGAIATSIAPFVGDALGAGELTALRALLLRRTILLAATGTGLAVALVVLRVPIADALFDEFGDSVARSILPFALVTPLAFVGFLATITLSAVQPARGLLLIAYALGTGIGLALVLVLARDHGVRGAATGCAIGLAATHVIVVSRFAVFLRELRTPPSADALAARG